MIDKHLGAPGLPLAAPAAGIARAIAIAVHLVVVSVGNLPAQAGATEHAEPKAATTEHDELDALVAQALEANPAIRAAADRVEAARARISPAGALSDPWIGVGIQNLPLGRENNGGHGLGGPDPMTMKMVELGQTIPFPEKLELRRRAAEYELAAAEASLAGARLEVEREVKDAYYELAFLDRVLEVLERSRALMASFVQVVESRYGLGVASQREVLEARAEAARLAQEAAAVVEQRRAALARLNAALDRPSDTPVERPVIPPRIAQAAVAKSPTRMRFAASALGARGADSPLPPLAELQETALRENPELRAQQAMISAQEARVELARKAHLPDFDFALQYGQRDARPDMVSAMVSVEIPIWKGRKQDMQVKEAEAELSALRAEHHARANAIRARVAELYAELERDRTQLALYANSIIPQGRAALASATASYEVGRADFLTVLENRATLYDYEIAYFRVLTDFARKLAELEQVVGKEVLR
ncbi:MAG TPA: TolC family protein [Longimicrobiales bacterium]